MRVVQRGPSVIRIQTRRTWSDRKTASQAGSIGRVAPKIHRPRQPEGVHQHDCWIVPGSDLEGALCQQRRCIAARETEFRNPLRGDQPKQQGGGRHAALFRETQLAVKPGPIAVSNVREGKPARMTRSSTNSTVGDDMLP